jgi:quercetin dioxygenase-like cupin family protein
MNIKQNYCKALAVAVMAALAGLPLTSCSGGGDSKETAKAESVEIFKTSQSWDGVELPDYPEGKPEVRAIKVTLPPHCSLPKHHHDIMSYGIIIKGQLTIVRESDGKEVTLHQGEAVAETVGTVHHGENRGDETTELYVFYASKSGMPLSVADE